MEQTTDWKIRLKEVVLGPLKRITEMAGGAQKKITNLATSTTQFAKASSTAGQMASGSLVSLTRQLQTLETLQSKAWDTKHIQNYQRAINKTKEQIATWHLKKNLPEMAAPKLGWLGRMKGQISEAMNYSPIGGNIMGMLKSPALAYGAAALAIASFGKAGVTTSMNVEEGMKKINATAQLPISTLGKLEDRLMHIGEKSGGNFDRIPDAYEKILSVSGKVNQSLDILQVGLKGAKAGFADVDLVGGALAQTLSVVGSQNTTAQEVMDTLLKAKAVGAGEFRDFATYLPTLIASGRSINATFKETAGLFSFLTFKGLNPDKAAMLLDNVFTALQKKEILVGMKKKGIDLFNVDGSRKDLTTIFTELTKKLDSLTDKQKTKFLLDIGLHDAQARTGLSVLTSDAENLKKIMGEVANAVGETDRQLALTGNRKRDWGDIADQWKGIGKSLGDAMLPVVDALGAVLQGIITATKDLISLDMFNMKGTDKKSIDQMREQLAVTGGIKDATQDYQKKYGALPNSLGELTKSDFAERDKFFKDRALFWKNVRMGNENKIVSGEEEASTKPLAHLNKVDNTSFSDKDDTTGGGNRGPKTLIMNLDIKNYFSRGDETVKQKTQDDIVDAARDAMVTIGDD